MVLAAPLMKGQDRRDDSGIVVDVAGDGIARAKIEVRVNNRVAVTYSDAAGRFEINQRPDSQPSGTITLTVSAPGFETQRISLSAGVSPVPIEVRLHPSPIIERIQVTATQTEDAGQGPVRSVLRRDEIENSGAVTLDDALRQVAGFSLFRRSGSLTANPTSQGVSLRGVGANGASRALALLDGVPLNSPFGGWVYWSRVPVAGLETVSVISGAASDVYGSGAFGGVINIETRSTEQPFMDAEFSGGSESTAKASAVGGITFRKWAITAAAQVLRTDGYVLVPENQRGRVDTPAATADVTGYLTFSRRFSRGGRAFARLNSFGESRHNGTLIQINDTRISSVDLGLDESTATLGDFSVRAYGSREIFNQNFSGIAIDRNSESLTNRQRNPSQQIGFAFQWLQSFGRQTVIAGFEARDVRGHSAETTFNTSKVTALLDAGGRQRTFAVFGQDSVHALGWMFSVAGRLDRWTDYDGFSNRIPVTGGPTLFSFTNRSETAFSPRVSASHALGADVSLTASFYKAFRAPTLNELYRSFRVGNVVTNANSGLEAERLTGGEAGIVFRKLSERLTLRGNLFWSQIVDPIANVTLSSTPTLINRQRQNLGGIRVRGIQSQAEIKITKHLALSAEYLTTDSTVLRFPANRSLEGLLVPQVPRHQFNFQTTYRPGKWTVAVQGRLTGRQFDDDQNILPLKRYFTLDGDLSRTLINRITVFVAAQNLTNTRYEIGRTPVLTVGPPALVRAGLRFRWR
jgi:outer membrane receptor protein involved in Fe transport